MLVRCHGSLPVNTIDNISQTDTSGSDKSEIFSAATADPDRAGFNWRLLGRAIAPCVAPTPAGEVARRRRKRVMHSHGAVARVSSARKSARKFGSEVGSKVGQQVGSKVDQVLDRDLCAIRNYPAPEPSTAPHVRALNVA